MMTIKFGPIMTAEEAKKHFCPLTMPCPDDTFRCFADECCAWMWLEDICKGLVSHDQYISLKEMYERAQAEGRRLGFCCK